MMMYLKFNGEVWAFPLDGSQDHFIVEGMVLMTDDEVDRYVNPQRYLTEEEKLLICRKNMSNLTPIEFDVKLNNNGLYGAVQELIKDNFEMSIAYNRATFFSRTDSFVDQARIALKLTDEQVDVMWTQESQI